MTATPLAYSPTPRATSRSPWAAANASTDNGDATAVYALAGGNVSITVGGQVNAYSITGNATGIYAEGSGALRPGGQGGGVNATYLDDYASGVAVFGSNYRGHLPSSAERSTSTALPERRACSPGPMAARRMSRFTATPTRRRRTGYAVGVEAESYGKGGLDANVHVTGNVSAYGVAGAEGRVVLRRDLRHGHCRGQHPCGLLRRRRQRRARVQRLHLRPRSPWAVRCPRSPRVTRRGFTLPAAMTLRYCRRRCERLRLLRQRDRRDCAHQVRRRHCARSRRRRRRTVDRRRSLWRGRQRLLWRKHQRRRVDHRPKRPPVRAPLGLRRSLRRRQHYGGRSHPWWKAPSAPARRR